MHRIYFASARQNSRYAITFINAANITNDIIKQALFVLEADLVGSGLISPDVPENSLIKFLWPMVGGTSTKHSFNFINPFSNPAGYSNGPTHTDNGVLFDGISQFADPGIRPSEILGPTVCMGFYARQVLGGQFHMGSYNGDGQYLTLDQVSGKVNAGAYCDPLTVIGSNQQNALGFRMVNRNNPNSFDIFVRNFTPQTFNAPASLPTNSTLLLGALGNRGAPGNFSNVEMAGAWIGDGLTKVQAASLRDAIVKLNTSLNRAV